MDGRPHSKTTACYFLLRPLALQREDEVIHKLITIFLVFLFLESRGFDIHGNSVNIKWCMKPVL